MSKMQYLPGEPGVVSLTGYLALRVPDFAHPREVLSDQDLTPMEKKALLAAWASDACSVESRPGFRWLSGTPGPVALDHILKALAALDEETEKEAALISAAAQRSRFGNAPC